MLSKLRDFLMALTSFSGCIIHNGYLGEENGSYSIENMGNPDEIRSYTDGGKVMEYKFKILLRHAYPDAFEYAELFFNQAADEIKECSANNILPNIGDNINVIDISPISNMIQAENDFKSVVYYMIFKIVYYTDK